MRATGRDSLPIEVCQHIIGPAVPMHAPMAYVVVGFALHRLPVLRKEPGLGRPRRF